MENFTLPLEAFLFLAIAGYVWISGMVCMETSNELKQGVRRVKSAVVRKGKV